MKSSLEIAQDHQLIPIETIAERVGLLPEEVEPYGRYKAKIDLGVLDRLAGREDAKLINVTAITPTKAGEGKTTTSVSLTQGLGHIGKSPVLCLREASLGPVHGNWKDRAKIRRSPVTELAARLGSKVRETKVIELEQVEFICPSCGSLLEVDTFEAGEEPYQDIRLGHTSSAAGEAF